MAKEVSRLLLMDEDDLPWLKRALEIYEEIKSGDVVIDNRMKIARRAREILVKKGFFNGLGGCTVQANQVIDIVAAYKEAEKEFMFEKIDQSLDEKKKKNKLSDSFLTHD